MEQTLHPSIGGDFRDIQRRVSALERRSPLDIPEVPQVPLIVTSGTRPSAPTQGQLIYESDTGKLLVRSGSTWLTVGDPTNIAYPAPRWLEGGFSNGTATTPTVFLQNNSLITAPRALRMMVTLTGHCGANGLDNYTYLQIHDQSGANITPATFDGPNRATYNIVNGRQTFVVTGYRDYTAGQTCGVRVAYFVNRSNIYLSAVVRCDFVPIFTNEM